MKLAVLALLGAAAAAAQQHKPQPPTVAQLEEEIAGYVRQLTDWGGLVYYGSENSELRPTPGRVVFIGDEITERWGEGKAPFFPGKPYLNRGITGQTTPQMLVRFRQDVISLQPAVVVIQGGSNDLGGNTGPGVLDRQDRGAGALAQPDGHRSSERELDGVRHQVQDNLLPHVAVDSDGLR